MGHDTKKSKIGPRGLIESPEVQALFSCFQHIRVSFYSGEAGYTGPGNRKFNWRVEKGRYSRQGHAMAINIEITMGQMTTPEGEFY